MRVSVVICTYNRADGLRATLECLHQQRFIDFEVVVVNGPSSDHTRAVLGEYAGAVRVVDNPQANLAVSRNLGIRASAGALVAFIDDDALPEPGWLEQIVPQFDDPEVAGVGGVVMDHTGMSPQYRYSAATRFGEPVYSSEVPFDSFSVPGAATFPYLQGTNAVFRRDILAQVGLFDETFDFYLDETDLCCRLVDAGYVLHQLENGVVHHKYLPSARRNQAKVVTNWHSIVRNHVYFGYRHAQLTASEFDVLVHAHAFVQSSINDARHHEELGNAPPGHAEKAAADCAEAVTEGIRIGRSARIGPLEPVELDAPSFRAYVAPREGDRLRIALVSSGYQPEVTGGIARYISDVAPELAKLGHEVRVFARAGSSSTVDLEDGVWVHRLLPVPTPGRVPEVEHVDAFASAVGNELERIEQWWWPDVMYGSLWDVEMLGVARTHPEVPIVPILATPVAEVAEHEGWTDPEHPTHELAVTLVSLERELIARSVRVHAISDAIVATFQRLYPGALHRDRVSVAPIGRADDVRGRSTPIPEGDPMVLYIGRLEPRKGIETFLDAATRLIDEHPTVRVVVAGDHSRPGPSGLRYPEWWARRGMPGDDRLEFEGPVGDGELYDLIEAATVVVMPSLYESFGLVAVEALMHARPVVASRVGGLNEVVDDGITGLLVPAADPEALARGIGRVVSDRQFAQEMGARGRAAFCERLDAAGAAQRLESVLRPIAVRRLGPTPLANSS
jgi:glycogen(starch) synthase